MRLILVLLLCALPLTACDAGDGDGAGSPVSDSEADVTSTVDVSVGSADSDGPDVVDEPEPCGPPDGVRPMRRSEHAGIYDPIGEQLVFYGGSLGVPVECSFPTSTFENETWLLDLRCNLWRKIDGGPPTGRTRHAAVYDSTDHRMIVFGGRYRAGTSGPYTPYGDVWAFDLETETWSQVSTTAGPSARANAGVAYDPTGHRLVVFGGNASSSGMSYVALNDTWTLSLVNGQWTEIATTGAPSPRLFQSALWDDAR
ncbi:MAG: kelch repeat-containing protein, partial [Myxococcota bacterium]|nr:kelch repeat-containing protein [Myxococcota bacterium]